MIMVKAADPNVVGLWERHVDQPGGEVWVAGEGEHEVAETEKVHEALALGRLVKVGNAPVKAKRQRNKAAKAATDPTAEEALKG